MERSFHHVLQLLSVVALIAVATLTSSCRKLTTSKVITSVSMASGVTLQVYLRSYYDTSLLGLEVGSSGNAPKYYWIAASPNVDFGALKLRIELSEDRRMLWLTGTSRNVASISAAYDDTGHRFYTASGVAREPSSAPDMDTMHFEAAELPSRSGKTIIVFDATISE